MNSRERFFALLENKPVDQLINMPITMMFAAHHIGKKYGRYALDYRLLAEAQMRIAEDYGFDHVSVISETREAPDCGAVLRFYEDQPYTPDESCNLLADKSRLLTLQAPEPSEGKYMSDRLEGISLLKAQCGKEKIIEGWLEGPCAAGADLRGVQTIMLDFYDDPSFINELFEFTTELAIAFGKAQINAGADVLGIGDAAASLIGPDLYKEFVWPKEKRLIQELQQAGAKIRLHICGDIRGILEPVGQLGCEIIDIDSLVPMQEARAGIGNKPCLLGGLDPVREVQDCSREKVLEALIRNHTQAGFNYIVGAGCEIPPGTPPENLRLFSEYSQTSRSIL
jgi:MtaA/CmuA family methyltransferase